MGSGGVIRQNWREATIWVALSAPWAANAFLSSLAGGFVFGLILPLVSFYVFVSIFSDGAESRARWQIFVVALVATLLLVAIARSTPTPLGAGEACAAAAAVSYIGLIFWIKVTNTQALKIIGSYIGFVVIYSLVTALIFAPRVALQRP
jgi:hypothetical protein